MTIPRDEILRMVREAGGAVESFMTSTPMPIGVHMTIEQAERFAALVSAAEREACAKEAEDLRHLDIDGRCFHCDYSEDTAYRIAKAIRARGAP